MISCSHCGKKSFSEIGYLKLSTGLICSSCIKEIRQYFWKDKLTIHDFKTSKEYAIYLQGFDHGINSYAKVVENLIIIKEESI